MEDNKIKFLILDIYPNDNWRLVKDTAGGYGTGNNFGNNYLGKFMNLFVSKTITMPPMAAIYVHSIIKNKNCYVKYTKKLPKDDELKNYNYVIMPSSIIAHETEIETLKKITSLHSKVFIIGIFANIKKDAYQMKNSFVVPGEPEAFFLDNKLDKENLDNFFTKEKKSYFGRPFVDNLDELPFPTWGDYLKDYPLRNNFLSFNKKNAIPIVASRGCPYSCFNYCTYPLQQGRKVRFRSVENIVNEIKKWTIDLNAKKFIFRDPVFSINRKFTVSLCEEIIKQNLKIEFLVETHLNNLDDVLIDLLFKAGLRLIYIGVESADDGVLDDMKRFTIKNDTQFKIIKKLNDKGINVKSMFMLGSPEDTEQTMLETIKYSNLLPNQFVQFSVFTPYPGTPIYKDFEHKITSKRMEDFNQYNLVFEHKHINNKILNKYKKLAYKSFYFRVKNFPTVLRSLFSLVA